MMKLTPLKSLYLMLLGTAFTTHAAINLDRTRIVFPESDKASSLKVENQSQALPYLALSWIEDENGHKEDAHFMALPPVQRIEAGSASQVRIVKQAATSRLPKDRETLFYFNLREVPPESTRAGCNAKQNQAVLAPEGDYQKAGRAGRNAHGNYRQCERAGRA